MIGNLSEVGSTNLLWWTDLPGIFFFSECAQWIFRKKSPRMSWKSCGVWKWQNKTVGDFSALPRSGIRLSSWPGFKSQTIHATVFYLSAKTCVSSFRFTLPPPAENQLTCPSCSKLTADKLWLTSRVHSRLLQLPLVIGHPCQEQPASARRGSDRPHRQPAQRSNFTLTELVRRDNKVKIILSA